MVIENLENITYYKETDYKKLKCQLFSLDNFIMMYNKSIIIAIKWDDTWIELIKKFLKTNKQMTFKIRLGICGSQITNFSKVFLEMLSDPSLSDQCIKTIKFSNKKIEESAYSKLVIDLAKELSILNVGCIAVCNWIVTDKLFQILLDFKLENTLWFRNWIFLYKSYEKMSIQNKNNKNKLFFEYCKYSSLNYKQLK